MAAVMGRQMIAGLVMALGLGVAGPGAADTAFARFSPLQGFSSADLAAPAPVSVGFGEALDVLEATDAAVRLRLPDGTETWVSRTDVVLSADGLVVGAGVGHATAERPRLWFWESHASLKAFLAGTDGIATDPSFEEVLLKRPTYDPAYPVIARDVAKVAGQQAQEIALVLLPVHKETPRRLAEVSGTGSSSFDIHFLVDVSGDALPFSQVTLATLAQDLSRRLQDDPNDYRVSVTYFGNNIRLGFQSESDVTWANLGAKPKFGPDYSGRWQDPLLAGLADALPQPRDGRRKAVLVILSGADLQQDETAPRLGGAVTLETLKPNMPDDLTILVAQVTPEPGKDLETVATTLKTLADVEYLPFENGLGRTLVGRIQAVLGVTDDRRIEPAEMGPICDPALKADLICFLPFAATTADRLPPPSADEVAAEWYGTMAWVVVEGLNLRFNPESAPP
jgi:hypothetical protein